MEFEYDEIGNTFYYVLLSFYALILLPATYFCFPTGKIEIEPKRKQHTSNEEVKVDERDCQCHGCTEKRKQKEANKPWKRTKKILTVAGLVVAWAIFAIIVKKVTEIESVHQEYDPYSILGVDQGAETSVVKKAYRELSKTAHPDRGGDAEHFDRIAKAYQALTDEESRENWEKYGNPDGPTATTYGIALPKWLVSKEYGFWVLAFYGLLFMVILPVAVGYWWYNSIKYNVDKVLLDTTQLFYYFLHKTPKMEVNRMLMILSGSFEFWKQYNKEIMERETDDVEVPRLMRQLPQLNENNKERPLCMPYALKARVLVHSHLTRLPLESESLAFDQRYILNRAIRLIEEMITMSQQITFYTPISLDTMENLNRLQPMFVQALWPKHSSLMQLPHITDYNVQFIRKQRIMNCGDLAALDNEKRRSVLKSLSDAEYRDVLVVLSSMPRLSIQTAVVVEGEDDAHEVTAGCVVTLKVTLTRNSLLDPQVAGLEDQRMHLNEDSDGENGGDSGDSDNDEGDKDNGGAKTEKKKSNPWAKQLKKNKGGATKKKNRQPQPKKIVVTVPVAAPAAPATAAAAPATPSEEVKEKKEKEPKKEKPVEKDDDSGSDIDDDDEGSLSGCEMPRMGESSESEYDEDEEAWGKKPTFEAKSHKTHTVHCPYYPGDKFEWWWLTLAMVDKKVGRQLATQITPVKTLIDEQTVELRFQAPNSKGHYHYQLSVRSDSYMDADYMKDIKLEVKEAKQIVLPKYEDTDDDEDKEVVSSEEEYTEGSDSDDE